MSTCFCFTVFRKLLDFVMHMNIFGTAKSTHLKFGVQIDHKAYYAKKCKIRGKMGVA